MNLAAPSCVLIADTRYERFPVVAAQFAALRGMRCRHMDLAAADFPYADFGPNTLLAMSHKALVSLNSAELRALKEAVVHGSSLYVRGGFSDTLTCLLAPFGLGAFKVCPSESTRGYRLADHHLIPMALRNEEVTASIELPGAQIVDCPAQVLAVRGSGASKIPFIFAIPCEAGVVIYDLMPDEVPSGATTPIVQRLANAAARSFDAGALVAANWATGRATSTVSSFNLVLDDRPRNYDYFNAGRLTRWLARLERQCPGIHVDFAWTPNDSRPSGSYLRALKRFNTGFVWHGLLRHVDHRLLRDRAADFREGRRLVGEISQRYAVRFQPIIIMPFEEVDRKTLLYLKQAGFLAAVFNPKATLRSDNSIPVFMRHSTPLHEIYLDYLPVLRRYPACELNRDWMLANAALDLPIIAAGHPRDVGLRRIAALYQLFQPVPGYFDEVAAFAREKGLRPRPLEEIAQEMIALPLPIRETPERN